MAISEDEVYGKVRQVLVDALSVDEEEVERGAKLKADLGAESIDYLDIQFQLEKAFTIKIEQKELQNMQEDENEDEDDVTVENMVKFVMTKVA